MEERIVIEIDGLAADLADMELCKTFTGKIEQKVQGTLDEYVYTPEAQAAYDKLYAKYYELIKGWEIKNA